MMRTSTYYRLTNLYKIYKGYVSTKGLMEEGLSNRQIAALTEEDYLEKVCHGCYWMKQCGYEKPDDYKCIEVCLSNPRAVIAMGSACYYQGGVSKEPAVLTVATERTDRSSMKMNFSIERHYFSNSNFQVGLRKVRTEFGSYNIYDMERSFCDMVRMNDRGENDKLIVEIVNSMGIKERQYERVKAYAQLLGMKKFKRMSRMEGIL